MKATTYGLDIAKSVFQLYWVDPQSGEISNRRFTRDQLIRFLGNRAPGRVALEACSGAHWWARKIASLGHQAILLHAKYVRPFVQTNKTDAADALAIWTAAQQPGMRTVAIKSEAQQAILSLHRIRSALVDTRTCGCFLCMEPDQSSSRQRSVTIRSRNGYLSFRHDGEQMSPL